MRIVAFNFCSRFSHTLVVCRASKGNLYARFLSLSFLSHYLRIHHATAGVGLLYSRFNTKRREIVLLLRVSRVKNMRTLVAIPRKGYLFVTRGRLSSLCKSAHRMCTFFPLLSFFATFLNFPTRKYKAHIIFNLDKSKSVSF